MAIARVQSNGNINAGATVAAAFSGSNTGGNLLIACVASDTDDATLTSLTDTRGNTWVACSVPKVISSGSGKGTQVGIFYAKNCAAGANTVTAVCSGGGTYLHVIEYSGCDTTAPFDQHGEAAQLGGSATPTSSSVTSTQADELLIGHIFNNRSSITAGAGYGVVNSQSNNVFSDAEDRIVSAIGSFVADSTISSGGSWAAAIATFKAAGATGGTPDHLAVVTQPSNAVTGIAHATQPVVAVKDASNVTVSSDTSTVTAALVTVTGTGTGFGTLTKACVSGQAFFTDLGVTSVAGGTFKWRFTDGALTLADSAVFTISARPNSPYLNLGTDGKDLGYDKALVDAGVAIAISGDRRGVTEPRVGGAGQWVTYGAVNRAQLPRTLINSDMPTWTQLQAMTVHNVSGDAAFLSLLGGGTLGTGGHVIVLDNAVTYTGDYRGVFPLRAGGDAIPGGTNVCIVISKAYWDSMVANAGTCVVAPEKKRVTSNANMAQFEAQVQIGNFMVSGATKGWRFVGLAFRPAASLTTWSHVMDLGDGDTNVQTTANANIPSNVIADRCWIDGHTTCTILHGIEMNCAYVAVVDCASGDQVRARFDGESHVICGYNGPGPFRVINNLINGGTEAFIIGGGLSACGMPSDLEFRYNYLTRPVSWNPAHPTYDGGGNYNKNIWETKATQYGIVEYNLLEHSWQAAQDGAGFNVKSESYGNGATIGYTSDITIRRNVLRDASMGTNVTGMANIDPAHPPTRVWFQDNLFRIGAQYYSAASTRHILLDIQQDCGFVHNTIISEGAVGVGIQLPQADVPSPAVIPGLVLLDNIQEGSTFDTWKVGGGSGNVTTDLNTVTGNSFTANKNAVIGANGTYPTTTYAPADRAAIVFEDAANFDYSLHGTTQSGTQTATALAMSVQPSNSSTGVAHATQPVVNVVDASSVTVATDASTVTAALVVVTGTGTALGTLTKVAVNGVADFSANGLGVTSSGGGTFKWRFTDGALTSVDSAVFTVAGAATALAMVTQPDNIATGATHATQPVVKVVDSQGVTVPGDVSTVTAALTAVTGTGTSIGTLTKAAVAGVASFSGNGLGVTSVAGGTFKWHFTDGALTAVDSAVFTVTGTDPNPPPPTGSNHRRRVRRLAGALQ